MKLIPTPVDAKPARMDERMCRDPNGRRRCQRVEGHLGEHVEFGPLDNPVVVWGFVCGEPTKGGAE